MRRERFAVGNFYHVYNRGVEKRLVFLNDRDRERFVSYLYFLNDRNFFSEHFTRLGGGSGGSFASAMGESGGSETSAKKKREPFVNIISWCLMPNHFHLLLEERIQGGISKFMQKLGTAYTKYFNTRYERSGVLFQGVFKSKFIDKEVYLTHLSRYIHLNPLELTFPKWEKDGVKDIDKATSLLVNYQWSSLPAYLNVSNRKRYLDKIIYADTILAMFDRNPAVYKKFLGEWMKKGISFDLLPVDKVAEAKH